MTGLNQKLKDALDCITFTESSGISLIDWQKSFLVLLFENDNKIISVRKNRRQGGSFVLQLYYSYLLHKNKDKKLLYVCPNTAMTRYVRNNLEDIRSTSFYNIDLDNIEFLSYSGLEMWIKGNDTTEAIVLLDEASQYVYDIFSGRITIDMLSFHQVVSVVSFGSVKDYYKKDSTEIDGIKKIVIEATSTGLELEWKNIERRISISNGELPQFF